jgi:hypothetical protein
MTPADLDEFTSAVIHMAQYAKKSLCREVGGPADSPPVLLWHTEKDVEVVTLPIPSGDDESMSAPVVLANGLKDGFVAWGKPTYVAFVCEAYMASQVDKEEANNVKRGELQKRFESGLSEDINEIISVLTFTTEGTCQHAVIVVKYGDDGMPNFYPHEVGASEEGKFGGAIVDTVGDFLRFVNAE